MATPTTPNRGYQLPDAANTLAVDLLRLVSALNAVDADVNTILTTFLKNTGNQSVAGIKTFGSSPLVPTPGNGDDSQKAINSAWARAVILAAAPTNLNTLEKIANALGNRANFETWVSNLIDAKADSSYVVSALAGKADSVHNHDIANIINLQTTLDALQSDINTRNKIRGDLIQTSGAGTWTCPAGVTRVKVTLVGCGGNGGTSGTSGAGGGGGAGATCIKYFTNFVPGATYSFTLAAGGSLADSTFTGPGGVTMTAGAGGNGTSAGVTGPAGNGGVATGGADYNFSGNGGSPGFYSSSGAIAGAGGGSIWGGGGRGVSVVSGQVAGTAANAPGAGGGGAVSVGGTSQSGGAGKPGGILFEY